MLAAFQKGFHANRGRRKESGDLRPLRSLAIEIAYNHVLRAPQPEFDAWVDSFMRGWIAAGVGS